MAASSSKPSPSNTAVKEAAAPNDAKAAGKPINDDNAANGEPPTTSKAAEAASGSDACLKDPPAAVVDKQVSKSEPKMKDPPSTTNNQAPPSYDKSSSSDFYTQASSLMKAGEFEQALVVAENGIRSTTEAVEAFLSSKDGKSITEDDGKAMLEAALAPFHYMYGTTLLYSVEETDQEQQMTHLPQQENSDGNNDSEGAVGPGAEEQVEDLQIAWENLETARAALERLLAKDSSNEKLKLDFAQVLLREGDLQKVNSCYEDALQSYSSCLKYREGNSLLEPYDRKLADVHYNLALVRTMQAVQPGTDDGDDGGGVGVDGNELSEAEMPAVKDAAAASAASSSRALGVDPQEMRERAAFHFLECGRIFGSRLAHLSKIDIVQFLKDAESQMPKTKSNGLEAAEGREHPKTASLQLKFIRESAARLTPEAAEKHKSFFEEVLEMLDEIRETIDEADTSENAISEMGQIRSDITAAVAQVAEGDEQQAADGANAGAGGGAFGSTEASAKTAAAQPLMMVKKKKKRTATEAGVSSPEGSDTKKKPSNASSE